MFWQTDLGKQYWRWVYTRCHYICIFWMHYSMVKPHCPNFRLIKTIWAASWQNQQNGTCTQQRLISAQSDLSSQDSECPIRPVWSDFAVPMKRALVLSYPLSAQWRLWPDRADALADLSLRWVHSHFVGFVMRRLIFSGVECFWFLQ